MKKTLLLILLLYSYSVVSQENGMPLFTLSGQSNFNIWRPLDNGSKKFISDGGKINTYIGKANIGVVFNRNLKIPLKIGVSYLNISHTVRNRIKSFTYTDSYNGNQLSTYVFNDPMDLENRSKSIGIFIEPTIKLVQFNKSSGFLGANVSVYFIEFYKSRYFSSDNSFGHGKDAYDKMILFTSIQRTKFSISSSSLELFYLHNFNLKPNFSLGVRASFGTNLYSNWDQFKRYIWAGVGLEIGFGGGRNSQI